jgi:hypothetical protein
MGSKWIKGGKAAWKALTSKKSPTITSVKIAPHLTTKRNIQDKVVKAVDEGTRKGLQGATPSQSLKQSMSKSKIKEAKKLKEFSYEYDRLVAKRKKK